MTTLRFFCALALFSTSALAHELELIAAVSAPAVVVRSTYAGQDPVPFAGVQVFAPGKQAGEYQTGRTDKRGVFSFVPDAPGDWRVLVDDEEGHRRELSITVPANFASSPAAAAGGAAPQASRWERALLGLALIFGATGILYGVKARRAG